MQGVDPAFGNWLAGFIDGEGCFTICYNAIEGGCSCRFTISVRADEVAVLREIERTLGIGAISGEQRLRWGNPIVRWDVVRKADCAALVDLLERFPLRAKKRQDLLLWREAVAYWNLPLPPGRDWTPVLEIKARLEAGRRYQGERA